MSNPLMLIAERRKLCRINELELERRLKKHDAIMADGIRPQQRQFVHLSESRETALGVGSRHGEPVLLEIKAIELASAGYRLVRSPGGTWLVKEVPPEFITRDISTHS